jgi:hypothetical protein
MERSPSATPARQGYRIVEDRTLLIRAKDLSFGDMGARQANGTAQKQGGEWRSLITAASGGGRGGVTLSNPPSPSLLRAARVTPGGGWECPSQWLAISPKRRRACEFGTNACLWRPTPRV